MTRPSLTPTPRADASAARRRFGRGAADTTCRSRAEAGAPAPAARAPNRGDRRRDGDDLHARSLARRHGRGDASRQGRLPHGRGGRELSGRLQDQPGAAGGVRRQTRHRHAHHRAGLCRRGHRSGVCRLETHRRVHDLELRHASDRPDRQLGCENPLHVGWRDARARRVPRPQRRSRPRRRPAQPVLLGLVRARAGPKGDRALDARRRQGPAQVGDPRSQSGGLPRKRDALRQHRPGTQERRLAGADRQGAHRRVRGAT